jgi:Tfp pilus assembly protein PilO
MKLFSKNLNYEKYYKDLVPYLKKEKNQKYLYIVLSISASIFFLILAINPTLSTIANLKRQIADARFVENKLSEKVRNLSALSQKYQEIEDDIPYVLDAIPQNPEVPTLIGQIRGLGELSSVRITNIEVLPVPLTSSRATESSGFAFSVIGNSNFLNTQTFLNNLIKMQRVLSINSIQTSKNSKAEDQVDFVFKGVAYFKK